MAYCRSCGNEIPEGVKFCTNCGSTVDGFANEVRGNEFDRMNQNDDVIFKKNSKRKVKREETGFEKFSKFFGVILLFIAIVDYNSDPPILTIILSLAIIVGAIFCLSQKYRLKGFTIIALVLAIFCLFAGMSQGKKLGFLKTPTDEEYAEAGYVVEEKDNAPEIQIETNNNNTVNSNDVSPDEKEPEPVKEAEPIKTADGVDPELKAFLDSYEKFIDEYILFMKKYMEDPGNAVSMLGEYASIMEKYGEFAEAVEKYDEKEMSTADAKYYLEVTNRINQKMLDIY
ncbi:MAG: zinc-ribbon domain-containing protein [Oscillospiraceae bacterium]|nr:zinc-ribbon domain-containing protein [Oscillospiraceae bacterium]